MEFQPLAQDNRDDFEDLMGPHGAYGGCWCMWWRLTRKVFEQQQGEGNRRAMQAIVEAYPSVVKSDKAPPTTSFMGTPETFRQAGFIECAAPSAAKRIMRYTLRKETSP